MEDKQQEFVSTKYVIVNKIIENLKLKLIKIKAINNQTYDSKDDYNSQIRFLANTIIH